MPNIDSSMEKKTCPNIDVVKYVTTFGAYYIHKTKSIAIIVAFTVLYTILKRILYLHTKSVYRRVNTYYQIIEVNIKKKQWYIKLFIGVSHFTTYCPALLQDEVLFVTLLVVVLSCPGDRQPLRDTEALCCCSAVYRTTRWLFWLRLMVLQTQSWASAAAPACRCCFTLLRWNEWKWLSAVCKVRTAWRHSEGSSVNVKEGEREGGREGETECVHPCKKNLGFRYFWKVRSFWTKITIDAIG